MSKAQATVTLRYAVAALLMAMAKLSIARALTDAGSIKGTVKATTGATEAAPAPIPGTRITLVNRDLPSKSVKTITDDAGNFAFANLPTSESSVSTRLHWGQRFIFGVLRLDAAFSRNRK